MTKNLGYTRDAAKCIARMFRTRSEFSSLNTSLYKFSKRRGWWADMSSHMPKQATTPKLWDEASVRAAAKSVLVKNDFINLFPGAYAAANRYGILIDICSHMDRRLLKSETKNGRNCISCGLFQKPEKMAKGNSNCLSCESKRTSKYAMENKAWKRSTVALRRARIANASPKWLSNHHIDEIKKVYKDAYRLSKKTGIDYEVDHIIPIRGKGVCGLHVPWNLRPIPKSENRSKMTSFEGGWP